MKAVERALGVAVRDDLHDQRARPAQQAEAAAASDSVDARLVGECLEGREEAWAALLAGYKRLIFSIPLKYGLSTQEATDVFQDVCVELLAQLPRLREPRALPKWLGQVTSHKCARLKEVAARQPTATAATGLIDGIADPSSLAEQVLLEVEREQALRDAVTALPPRCHQLIQALFFETPVRPYREIAQELNLALGSIGFIRGRCLGKLRHELQKNGFK
jgi:RNA polymerase sigma factor (sigma-70 family)